MPRVAISLNCLHTYSSLVPAPSAGDATPAKHLLLRGPASDPALDEPWEAAWTSPCTTIPCHSANGMIIFISQLDWASGHPAICLFLWGCLKKTLVFKPIKEGSALPNRSRHHTTHRGPSKNRKVKEGWMHPPCWMSGTEPSRLLVMSSDILWILLDFRALDLN